MAIFRGDEIDFADVGDIVSAPSEPSNDRLLEFEGEEGALLLLLLALSSKCLTREAILSKPSVNTRIFAAIFVFFQFFLSIYRSLHDMAGRF